MGAVLVIEDDDDVREAMVESLRDEGYEVLEAANGLDALDVVRKHSDLKLILLDLSMPVMDGWEFCEQLQKEPVAVNAPVILLSGTSSVDAEMKALKAAGILPKPFTPSALVAAVRAYCKPT